MKNIKIILFLLLTNFISQAQNAQWQMCNSGSCNYFAKCFIETSGALLGAGGCISTDSGSTWALPSGGIYSFCLAENSAGIFAGSDTAIYFSNNNGASWTNVYNTGSSNFVLGLTVLNDSVFAATRYSGILLSPDNGLTWAQVNTGLPNDSIYSILTKGNLLFAGMFGSGIYMSSNSGVSWSAVNAGLPLNSYVPSITTDGVKLYVSTGNAIFTSSNLGQLWTQSNVTAPSFNKILAVGNAVLAGGFTSAGAEGMFRSLDSGNTWSVFNHGLPVGCAYGVAGIYATSSFVFCGIESQCGSIFRINRNLVLTSVKEINGNTKNLYDIFPNPFSNELHFKTNNNYASEIYLYDIFNRKLLQQPFANSITLNTSKFAKGVYLYEIRNGDGLITKGKVFKD